jgi:ABC-type hemin transport system ATPase subunit
MLELNDLEDVAVHIKGCAVSKITGRNHAGTSKITKTIS